MGDTVSERAAPSILKQLQPEPDVLREHRTTRTRDRTCPTPTLFLRSKCNQPSSSLLIQHDRHYVEMKGYIGVLKSRRQ